MKKRTKTHKHEALLKSELRNPEFRKAYEDLQQEFGLAAEVIRLRLRAGLTQKDLAERMHTSQPAISRLESGEYHNVSLAFLRRMGGVFGVTPVVHFKKTA